MLENILVLYNKIKNKKYHTVGTVPKSNKKIVERGKIDTFSTQIHVRSLTFLAWYRHFNRKWQH
jgi:hypothetical protein